MRRTALGVAISVTLATNAVAANRWDFNSSATSRLTYTSNLNLTATDERDSLILELSPAVSAKRSGARVQASVDYSARILEYSAREGRDRTEHQLSSSLDSELIQDRFFLEADVSYSQQLTDRTNASTGNTINASDNFTDTATFRITPIWKQRIGRYTSFLAQASYDRVDYSDLNQDSEGVSYELGLDTRAQPGKIFWTASIGQSGSKPDNADTQKSDSSFFRVTYRQSKQLIPNVSVGYIDNHLENPTSDQVDAGVFWGAGVNWRPNPRNSLEANYNSRLASTSRGLSYIHQRRKSNWVFSYQESVTSTRRQLLDNASSTSGTGTVVPVASLTSEQFIDKSSQLVISAGKGKSRWNLSLFDTRRKYQVSQTSEHEIGSSIGWNWKLSGRSNFNASMNWSRIDPDTGSVDTTIGAALNLKHTMTQKASLIGELRTTQRRSDTASREYDNVSAIVGLNITF